MSDPLERDEGAEEPRKRTASGDPVVVEPVPFEPRRSGGGRPRLPGEPGRRPRLVPLLVGLLLLLLVTAAGLLLTARTVRVEARPFPDRLALRGDLPALVLGDRLLALPGDYSLEAEKEGYERLEVPVEVTREPDQVVTLEMQELPAEPTPAEEATEAAPETQPTPRPEAAAEPAPEPQDPAEPSPRSEAAIEPRVATLELVSTPPGATVEVAGAYRGSTPLDLELDPGQEHPLRLSKAGHESAERAVELAAGEERRLEVALEPRRGRVELAVSPPDAEIVVNGESRGAADQIEAGALELPAAPHEVEVRKQGFEPYRGTVTPVPGMAQTLAVELAPAGRGAAAPPRLTSPEEHELLLVEPGRFTMGAPRREPGRRANEVLREVELTRPFYLATREVTNRQFRRFREGHLSGQLAGRSLETDHHPVVRVSWEDAAAYCNWLSAEEGLTPVYERRGGRLVARRPFGDGYRLPTEAEWAWAARSAPGGEMKKYPWGSSLPIPAAAGNWADESAEDLLPQVLSGYRDGHPVTAPADGFAPNARGFHHLGGNVAEWVNDVYTAIPSVIGKVETDPLGPEDGAVHTVRGSSWMDGAVTELRLTYREAGGDPRPDLGFRVARSLPDRPGGGGPSD